MASPTIITVTTDREEYSRNEESRSVITATVVSAGGTPYDSSDVVVVELVKARRNRDAVVASAELVLAASSGNDTQTVQFDLKNLTDSDGINLVRRGKYFIRARYEDASDPDPVSGESPDFHVSVLTAERLRTQYLYGLPLGATLSRQVRYQPNNVTGVTVVHLSEEHPFGFYTLAYNVSSTGVRTLAWGGGTSTVITASGKYLLKTGSGTTNSPLAKLQLPQAQAPHYIEVQVDFASLPSDSTSDEMLVEKQVLDDAMLRDLITQSTDWLEQVALQTFIEPTNVVTDLDPTALNYTEGTGTPVPPAMIDADYDFLVNPLTYFSQQADQWLQIQTPYMNILRVDLLFGAIANVRVIDIDLDWVEHSGKGGFIQLIPFNTQVAFSAAGLLWIGTLRSPTEIPNFWHFDMMVGLPEVPPNLQEIIAKKAAIDALILLGQALRPGVGSMSLGRDGVSQSISYTNQAQYGAYTGTITLYKEWIDKELKNYRGTYRGPMMVVV